MNNTSRTWVSMIVTTAILLVVIFTMPVYEIAPRAIFLPANTVKPPYTGSVGLYDTRTEPFLSETLGVINLRYHTNNFADKNQSLILDMLKEMAANAGGNGVVLDITRTGLTASSPSAMQVIMATGKVIYANNY